MTEDEAAGSPGAAEDIYGDFLRRRREGEDVDLEEYCRRHPRLAHALRALHSIEGTPGSIEERPAEKSTVIVSEFDEAVARVPAREEDPRTGPMKPGDRVGAYQVREVLGEGGFAFVYRADQLEPVRRPVALKTIKLGLDTRQVIARFEAERQALALMSHSHIARVYDAGVTADGRPYFVMEYVDGQPITEYCDAKNLSVEERLELFLLVCDAVQHAHQKAIIHRDLKPSNVLVTVEGDRAIPKIIDFGIAKATIPVLDEATLFTQTGQIIGTPEYMSPEQVDAGAIDTRTDIYALGVMLYELLCGARPFDPKKLRMAGFAEIWRIIREEMPPRPSTRLSTLGESTRDIAGRRRTNPQLLSRRLRGDLDWIAMKSLAKKPEERYASASEFAADLRRHLDAQPVLAGPPGLGYRLRKFAYRRRRALVAVFLALVAALVAGVVVRGVVERRQHEERIAESGRYFERGQRLAQEARDFQTKLGRSEEEHRDAQGAISDWVPIWERGKEIEAWSRVLDLRRGLEDRFTETFLEYTKALNLAPERSEPWRRVFDALDVLSEEIEAAGRVSFGNVLLRQQIESTLATGASLSDVLNEGPSLIRLMTDPSDAQVYLFRYEEPESEMRLLPLPFAPGEEAGGAPGRIAGKPFLQVERIWDEDRAALVETSSGAEERRDRFRPGDRIVSIAGHPVSTRGDLARALRGVETDASVALRLRRDGEILGFRWVPFRKEWYGERERRDRLEPGRVVCIRDQFGFTFEGYPLDFRPECSLGRTASGGGVSVKLPRGSYLFVLRRDGYIDTRYPLNVREQRDVVDEVRLLKEEDVPTGFVYVPAGPFIHGGSDHEYLQNLEYGESRLDGFFMSQREVTFGDYLAFLNARVDDRGGWLRPETRETKAELELIGRRMEGKPPSAFRAWPINEVEGPLVERTGDRWVLRGPFSDLTDAPLFGVSYLAAVEYAHWLSETQGKGWRYRLPTDDEWEKAARGADGRIFVWGDYMVWSFCWNKSGIHLFDDEPAPLPALCPFDESVFGVRDLAGSVHEPTTGRTKDRRRYIVLRGGSWEAEDEYEFRADMRLGFKPENPSRRIGIRLVADLEPSR